MRTTRFLSAQGGPHVGPRNLSVMDEQLSGYFERFATYLPANTVVLIPHMAYGNHELATHP